MKRQKYLLKVKKMEKTEKPKSFLAQIWEDLNSWEWDENDNGNDTNENGNDGTTESGRNTAESGRNTAERGKEETRKAEEDSQTRNSGRSHEYEEEEEDDEEKQAD